MQRSLPQGLRPDASEAVMSELKLRPPEKHEFVRRVLKPDARKAALLELPRLRSGQVQVRPPKRHGFFRNLPGPLLFAAAVAMFAGTARAQETPYFITYSHRLEEPGNLELEFSSNYATERGGNDLVAPWLEIEYGATGWWTTEIYFDSQHTFGDGAIFTGWRWENRFRPLMREHWINPVLYVEYEDVNGADKTMLEVVGFDGEADHAVRNAVASREHLHEIETKLILSSDFKGWNISENFIAEKNTGHAPWEFGYAVAASRPLRLAATARPCNFCRENLVAGLEMYGGLGTTDAATLSGTSHYLAPVVAWQMPNDVTLRVSPGWGLTHPSHRFLLRWGVTYEISGFGGKARKLFR